MNKKSQKSWLIDSAIIYVLRQSNYYMSDRCWNLSGYFLPYDGRIGVQSYNQWRCILDFLFFNRKSDNVNITNYYYNYTQWETISTFLVSTNYKVAITLNKDFAFLWSKIPNISSNLLGPKTIWLNKNIMAHMSGIPLYSRYCI